MISRAEIERYLAALEIDAERRLAGLIELIESKADVASRRTMPGHVTGSGIVADGARILVIHHARLDRWLQPGGHLDPGERPVAAALRETVEETGVAVEPHPWHARAGLPVDVDAHVIPASARHGEPEHVHFDFRYVLRPRGSVPLSGSDEVTDVRWVTAAEARALALPADLWRALRRAAELDLLPAAFARQAG